MKLSLDIEGVLTYVFEDTTCLFDVKGWHLVVRTVGKHSFI